MRETAPPGYCHPPQPSEPCNQAKNAADAAATAAVKEVFAILGVDVDSPKDVEEFRKDLRFGGMMRKAADNSVVAFIAILITAAAAAMLVGFGVRSN